MERIQEIRNAYKILVGTNIQYTIYTKGGDYMEGLSRVLSCALDPYVTIIKQRSVQTTGIC